MHQKRPVGRNGLAHARDRLLCQEAIERQHAAIGFVVDVAAELHRDCAVAAGQEARRRKWRSHRLTTRYLATSQEFAGRGIFAQDRILANSIIREPPARPLAVSWTQKIELLQ